MFALRSNELFLVVLDVALWHAVYYTCLHDWLLFIWFFLQDCLFFWTRNWQLYVDGISL